MTQFEQLLKIYDRLPKIPCQGKCQGCCTIIALSPIEVDYLHSHGIGLPTVRYSKEYDHLMCSRLTMTGRCNIHAYKPLICRLWGLTETMPCPHGCQPERVISREEMLALMLEVDGLKRGDAYWNKDGWGSDRVSV